MASNPYEFSTAYLNVPFEDDPDARQIYEAAQEYVRRVNEFEGAHPGPQHRWTVSKFALRVFNQIAHVRRVDHIKLHKRIRELTR